jgi:hypothetical protein
VNPAAVVVAVAVLVMAVLLVVTRPQSPGARFGPQVRQECLRLYAEAHTFADSVHADAHYVAAPVFADAKHPLQCGTVRAALALERRLASPQ